MQQYFAKKSPNIQRNTQTKCSLCEKEFRFGRTQHQCKRCLRPVCADCGKEKIMHYKYGFTRNPHRGCKLCVDQINGITQYISSNQINFGKMSLVGEKWMKKIDKYSSFIPNEDTDASNFKRQVFTRMWDSYNYSIRQFIGMLTFEIKQQQIYAKVNAVVKGIFSVYAELDLESVAYLAIFVLCFCSQENAVLVCLHLIELRSHVMNSQGLIQAYLKVLSLNRQPKINDYMQYLSTKYIDSFSINYAHLNSSIYLLQKIITRKKIDELYIFMCVSVDVIKDYVINAKGDASVYDMYLVRLCTPNSISVKYRQATSVNSSIFMKEGQANIPLGLSSTDIGQKQSKPSYSPPPSKPRENSIAQKKNYDVNVINQNKDFQRRYAESIEDQMSQADSLSMSILSQMKDLQRPNQEISDGGGQLLQLLEKGQKIERKDQDLNRSFQTNAVPIKSRYSNVEECQNCARNNQKIQSMRTQLKDLDRVKEAASHYRAQNLKLKQKLQKLESGSGGNRQADLSTQKIQLEKQLKQFKEENIEYQTKQRQYQSMALRYDEAKKIIKKQQSEIRSMQIQLEESSMTNKMLKNKLQTQDLKPQNFLQPLYRESESTNGSLSDSKVIQILKQNVKEKNIQIEQLTKRNKLLTYQLEEYHRSSKKEGNQSMKVMIDKDNIDKEDMIKKLNQLSLVLMNEEGEKLRLSQQNFALRQQLKHHKIPLDIEAK